MIEAYPLYWPPGRPKTPSYHRENARFDISFARARDEVLRQVLLLKGRYTRTDDVIISTNVPLRRDGLPLANYSRIDDVGVAVYFTYRNQQTCFACDRWQKIEDNMQAIAKTIDALRGIARWGTGDMMEAAFRGFTAIGSDASESWWIVLGVSQTATLADVNEAYRRLRSTSHPDRPGGDATKFHAVQRAFEQATAQR